MSFSSRMGMIATIAGMFIGWLTCDIYALHMNGFIFIGIILLNKGR